MHGVLLLYVSLNLDYTDSLIELVLLRLGRRMDQFADAGVKSLQK
jgi:hypothetical protein